MARSGTSGSHPDYPGPVKHWGVTVGAWRVAACRHERPVGLLVDFRPATRLQACNSIPGSTVSDDALFTVLGAGCGRSGCLVAIHQSAAAPSRVRLCQCLQPRQLLCIVLLVFSCCLVQSFWSLMSCCLPICGSPQLTLTDQLQDNQLASSCSASKLQVSTTQHMHGAY